jgi:nickel/cobalt transporter (NicO) family protein
LVTQLIIGTLTISILHGLIPSHWIPILAFEKKYHWDRNRTIRVTILAALFHSLSTVILGVVIGFASLEFSKYFEEFSTIISSALLVILGVIFIFRHHHHHHFHLDNEKELKKISDRKIITVLFLSMFFSPCLEVEGYFVIAGTMGMLYIFLVSLIYVVISVAGVLIWIVFARKLLSRINAHKIEHNSGLISGLVLILTGILNYFIH